VKTTFAVSEMYSVLYVLCFDREGKSGFVLP